MRAQVYKSIDDIGHSRLAVLPSNLDFSFGLLRAVELSLWGELLVRYITVEDNHDTIQAFTPVYVGSNLNFNALLPKFVEKSHDVMLGMFGKTMATRAALAGSLISDRGWIPMHPKLADRTGALRLMLKEIDRVAKENKAQLGMIKDIHSDFPAAERALMREAGFTQGYSLPTIRISTDYNSFEDYLTRHLTKNGRKHARRQFRKAEGMLTWRVVEHFESMIPSVFALYRTVFLRAKYKFEELPPRFFVECARSTDPRTEMVNCETADGKIVGSLLIFYNQHEQQNKRIGIDYDFPESALVYNLLNYVGIQRAIARGIKTLWLGQSSYVTKTRLGGRIEDQYALIKAYDPLLKPTLPLQRWWMSRYSAAKVQAYVESGLPL